MIDLGRSLLRDEPDAYSLWCASTCGDEVDPTTDHEVLDRISDVTDREVKYGCQCGPVSGERCSWRGHRSKLVRVRYVRESDRGSAEASGTYDCYGGAVVLSVCADCAERLAHKWVDGEQTDELDPFVRVLGAAYECIGGAR